MKRTFILTLLFAMVTILCPAQSNDFIEKDVAIAAGQDSLRGKLLLPAVKSEAQHVVIIIAGSGPTDMNGNTTVGGSMNNNSLKMLAEALAHEGIASLRYDKRGVASSASSGSREADLRFDHYVDDAAAWADFLQTVGKWQTTTIIGHSEGALIGMIAAQRSKYVTNYVSIAGAGRLAYQIIEEQLAQQPEEILRLVKTYNATLCLGITLNNVPQYLEALYRPSVQPYLISWFKYNPTTEIGKLKIPVLILQGDTDIQVSTTDAQLLKQAAPEAKLCIILGMNHVLKPCDSMSPQAQLTTYSNPTLQLHKDLIPEIVKFIRQK